MPSIPALPTTMDRSYTEPSMPDRAPRPALELAQAVLPPALRPGDTIGVIAPSGPPAQAPLLRGLAALERTFRVRVSRSALPPRPPAGAPYLAASDDERADELNQFLADRGARAIVMARGGYGLMRILPALDASALRADPKPLVGFSDGTALLSWALAAGVRGIHGPVAVRLGDDWQGAADALTTALTDPTPLGRLRWRLRRAPAEHTGEIVAPMLPSNLVMTGHLVGTPWELPLAGAAWWFEEVGERPYELDRCLTQLALSGALARVAGAVVGELVRCTETPGAVDAVDDPAPALAVVLERLRGCGVPALTGAPFGHGRANPPLPFGARCLLDFSSESVEVLEAAVAKSS